MPQGLLHIAFQRAGSHLEKKLSKISCRSKSDHALVTPVTYTGRLDTLFPQCFSHQSNPEEYVFSLTYCSTSHVLTTEPPASLTDDLAGKYECFSHQSNPEDLTDDLAVVFT